MLWKDNLELGHLLSSFPVSWNDVFTLVPVIILLALLFYFSNLEIKKSLEQSRKAQELLSKDRDELREKFRQERMTRLNELAKAAEFGRLSQGFFHDLITPLTSVILHTEKLGQDKAIEASRRMASYIKDMRATLSREETEREFLLKDELESVIRILSYHLRDKNVQIIKSTNDSTWFGSPTKIRQIFSNLISNSIDSFETTKNKENIVQIEIFGEGTNIKLRIIDNGCGISKENMNRIFEPFFTTKAQDKGTGIGLTSVKSIVEKSLGGTIGIESTVGVGTAVTITFPRENRDPAAYHSHQ